MAQSFGRYELVHPLGKGGMGEVYLARLTGAAGFEKLCIVKTLLPEMNKDPLFVQRFQHEAKVLVHLNHASIAQVYDMGEAQERLYMAIEYIPGVDLGRILERLAYQGQRLPVAAALYIAQRMSEALGYAHRKVGPDGKPLGVVHRDISPQNVMVSYEGEVKVIDFGLAKSRASSKSTLPSMVMGKLGYMSPEQARGEPVDYRSDIFSGAVVLWEMLTGRSLYPSDQTVGEMVAAMNKANIPPPRSIRPELSDALNDVVMKALAKDPSDRFARADDFAKALNELFIREHTDLGPEEIGNQVREICPEEYQAQARLISSLSKAGTKPTAPLPIAEPLGSAATFVRASTALESPVSAVETSVAQSNRWVFVAAGAVIALAGIAGPVFVRWRPERPLEASAPVVAPEPPVRVAKAQPPPKSEPEPAIPQGRVPSTVAYPVFVDRGEYYVRAGIAQGFELGSAVQVVGPEEEDGRRAFWGEGTVVEASESLVRFQVEDSVKPAPKPLFAATLRTTPVQQDPPKRKRRP